MAPVGGTCHQRGDDSRQLEWGPFGDDDFGRHTCVATLSLNVQNSTKIYKNRIKRMEMEGKNIPLNEWAVLKRAIHISNKRAIEKSGEKETNG